MTIFSAIHSFSGLGRKRITIKVLAAFLLLTIAVCLPTQILLAQDSSLSNNKWHFQAEPYLMFPNLKGSSGLGTLPDAEVDADPGDVFSHFKGGGMLYVEAHNNQWAITSDVQYLKIRQSLNSKNGIVSGDVQVRQFVWEAALLRRMTKWLEVGAGTRLYSMENTLNMLVKTPGENVPRSKQLSKTWVDPILIARGNIPMPKRFTLQMRADFGGFGIGSKISWQVQADAAYHFSKLFQLGLGYRYVAVNYKHGSGENRFLYNMDTFGPEVKLGFNL